MKDCALLSWLIYDCQNLTEFRTLQKIWGIEGVFGNWSENCGADMLQCIHWNLVLTYLVLEEVSRCWLYVHMQALCLEVLSEGSSVQYQRFSMSFSFSVCRNDCGICICCVNEICIIVIMIYCVMVKYLHEICHFHLCYSELQRIILELVAQLAHYKISAKELSLYLNIFKSENPPLVSIIIWRIEMHGLRVLIELCSVFLC